MASQTSRQATGLLSLFLRPRSLKFVPNRQIIPSSQRCVHSEQQQTEQPASEQPEERTYERKPTRLPYTTKRFHNARPQPRAPYPVRARKYFAVNDDPKVLNEMYLKLFGKDMRLPEEVKWQAVTHKSFDHGRQPYNAKLKFLGKKLLELHASFHLLGRPLRGNAIKDREGNPQKYFSLEGAQYQNPEPFFHKDYKNMENVTSYRIKGFVKPERLVPLTREVGLAKVMRWKPAEIADLSRSGRDVLAVECLFAIIGALALQKGGKIAGEFIKERILAYKQPPGSMFPLSAPSTKPADTTSSEATPAAASS